MIPQKPTDEEIIKVATYYGYLATQAIELHWNLGDDLLNKEYRDLITTGRMLARFDILCKALKIKTENQTYRSLFNTKE